MASEQFRSTVVLVTHRHRDLIGPCLDELLPTLGEDDEVVVVDNGSTDGIAEAVAPYGSRVRLHREGEDRGFGAGANAGARVANGATLVFVGVDARPRAGWMEALLSAVDASGGRALVGALMLLLNDPDRVDALGNDVHLTGMPSSRLWGERAVTLGSRLEQVASISGNCFALRRDLFDRLGGFDERFFLYCEDTELSLRARLLGHPCIVTTDAVVLHDHRPGTPPLKLYYLERNRMLMLAKLLHGRTLLGLIPALAIAELVGWGYALLGGPRHLVAKARAVAAAIAGWRDARAAGRSLAAVRAISDRELLRALRTRLPGRQAGAVASLGEPLLSLAFAAVRPLAKLLAR